MTTWGLPTGQSRGPHLAINGGLALATGSQLAIGTLFQDVYRPQCNGMTSTPRHSLRTGQRHRRPQRYRRRRTGMVDPAVSIDARLPEVQDRTGPDHIEDHLIIGRNGGTAIGTLVERTRFVTLVHVPGRRTANAMTAALVPIRQALPASLRLSLNWDQGNELAQHRVITAEIGTAIYFCHAHSPWTRRTNESLKALLRQCLPKGYDLGSTHRKRSPRSPQKSTQYHATLWPGRNQPK